MIVRGMAVLALAGALPWSAAGQQLWVHLVTKEVLGTRLEAGLVRPGQRQATIRKMFEEAGCRPEEQALGKNRAANVICSLSGESKATIVVGGHYDYEEDGHGKGIVDDWSGASMLVSLYEALKDVPRKHSYVFVAFAEEENGLVGSKYFVKHMSAELRENFTAFVNLECLGMTPVKVWVSRADPELVTKLLRVGRSIQVVPTGVNVEQVGDDDSHPFKDKNLPVITLHSVTQQTLAVLHSGRDGLKAIDQGLYFDAYRLAAFYLAFLDN